MPEGPSTSRRVRRTIALVLPLAVSVLLAGLYLGSVRRHSRAVDAAGERLAGMVSRDLADLIFLRTQQPLGEILRRGVNPYALDLYRAGMAPRADDLLRRLAAVVDSIEGCDCAPTIPIHDLLVVETPGSRVSNLEGRAERWDRRLSRDPIDGVGERLRPMAGTDPDGRSWFAFFARFPGSEALVIGLEIDLEAYGAALLDDGLPTLASSFFESSPLESALAVELHHPDGTLLYRRGPVGDGPTADVELFGNELIATYRQLDDPFLATVTISPEALPEFIPGGTPRLPVLPLLLIVSAVGFGVAGLRMLSREQALAEARQRFLLSIQHEMRTPLAQIRAYGETLQLDRPVPEARRRAGDVIVRETDRLTAMVDNALDVARSGPRGRAARTLDLEAEVLVARLRDSVALLLRQRELHLRIRQISTRAVRTDPDLLHRLLLALMENAIRFSEPGGEIGLELADAGSDVAVRIIDHGPGIPEAHRSRLWSPFESMDRDGRSGGTGLGLAIARELAGTLGVALDVEDTPGGGATFVVRLPAAEA